ncbi:MAG: peptide ABC transporter substrate-binding protein [Chloroflexi bacterium]|nr:peptide ABC transporter substrate-binding protein [Chloroflexota bacterium]
MFRSLFIRLLLIAAAVMLVLPTVAGCRSLQTTLENIDSGPGGTLNLWDIGPLTLDPAISSEMYSHIYVMQIFSGLVKLDSDLKIVPDIAERWEISPDGKTYTFYLREDAKFQDGRKVTAGDVKYSIERTCDPATGSQTASTYLNDIVGAKDMLSGKAASISSINIIDDQSISITIDAPKTYFLSKLAYPTAFMVDKKNVQSGSDWWRKPNGTGPYKLAKWDEGSLILLRPNQYYYGQKATVNVASHILAGIPMSLYETGEIDAVEVSRDYIDRAADKTGPFYDQLHIFPEFSLQYIGFNTSKPPFDDPYVRQAFCLAVNRERIIRIIQKDMVSMANGIIPIGMPGYNKDMAGVGYDPVRARELLGKSKYSAGLPHITVTAAGLGGVDVEDYLGAIIQDWKVNLGADVSVRLLDTNVYQYNLRGEADEMFAMGWVADYPDPQNFLYTLFYSGSEYNYSHFSNKELDGLLDKAAVEADYDKRIGLYQEAEKIIVDQAPVMPLWFGKNYTLVNHRVHNYDIDPLGVPKLNLVTLDK